MLGRDLVGWGRTIPFGVRPYRRHCDLPAFMVLAAGQPVHVVSDRILCLNAPDSRLIHGKAHIR